MDLLSYFFQFFQQDKEVESKLSPPESITFLAPPSEIPRSTSASNMGRTGSRPRPKVFIPYTYLMLHLLLYDQLNVYPCCY